MEIWIGESLLAFAFSVCGALFWMAASSFGSLTDRIGPAHFPKLLALSLILLGGINLFRAIRRRKKDKTKFSIDLQLLRGIILSAAYIFLIPAGGYFIVTPIFSICLLLSLGYRNPLKVALVTMGFTIVAYVLFYKILSVPLPV
ncbi:MAG: tripartite tricarboxylate transporter TctB family protein [Synergistaceae bacterium]|jgi:hypothetical protein|nr:tripartite tricarboxylate transporter TctB family protein [Synergistaceae bacterium]